MVFTETLRKLGVKLSKNCLFEPILSQRNDGGGSCNNLSHQAECCTSELSVQEEKCGWIFDNYGTKVNCPSGILQTTKFNHMY